MHQNDDEVKHLTSNHDFIDYFVHPSLNSRIGFIRKVYSILSVQLLLTAIVTFICITNESIQQFQLENDWLFILISVFTFVFFSLLFYCKENSRKVPRNYIFLGGFTLCEAYLISAGCSQCVELYENGMQIIIMALSMTVLMTVGLTMYACTTEEDFTIYGGLLWSLSVCLLCALIFLIFFENEILEIVVTIASIFLYSFYLLYDTQQIVGGKRYDISMDDYIYGSIALYLDIIILFLDLLKLFSKVLGKKR